MDLQWKLGLAMSSGTCRSLNSPFVSVLLKIAEPSGQISQRSFEMTIPQFQVCMHCGVIVVLFCAYFITYWIFRLCFFLFLFAELSQAGQRNGSCYGDCMMVTNTHMLFSLLHKAKRRTAQPSCLSAGCITMWIQMTQVISGLLCTSVLITSSYMFYL